MLTPDEALARMKQGNADFLADSPNPPPIDHQHRIEIALGQSPFAVLVGCSDSRVSPELLFGTGLGALFIVRNAGNTVEEIAWGSIEYGVLILGAPLTVVLGHQRCGAVQAAVQVVTDDAKFPGSIGRMIEPVIPAVVAAQNATGSSGEALVEASVRENIRRTVDRFQNSEPSLTPLLEAGKLRVVGAEYNLDEGKVDFFIE